MKRLLILAVMAAALLALLVAPPLASAAIGQPTVVTEFTWGEAGSFAESMAADSHGNLWVSLTRWGTETTDNWGEIYRITPSGSGSDHPVASMDLGFTGAFMGVAIDGADQVYVAQVDFSDQYGLPAEIGNAVWRVDGKDFTKVVSLAYPGWPNGLAFNKGKLYIGDAGRGAIWRARVDDGLATPSTPWFQDPLLAPSKSGLGINGIAFKGGSLFGIVSATGRVVAVPVKKDGSAGALSTVTRNPLLKTGDGIAFDILGRLWIAVNGASQSPAGALYRMSASGALTAVAENVSWLNYPTQPVFGRTADTAETLFVSNGAYNGWADGSVPDIIALPVGVAGLIH